jgi:hypothetical protein
MFSKFGAQYNNTATFYGPKSAFKVLNIIPKPGDLIFYQKSDKIFQVENFSDETPFYPLGKNMSFKLECNLYSFNSETADVGGTGIPEIDNNLFGIDDLMVAEENTKVAAQIVTDNVLDSTERNPLFDE